MLTFSKNNLDLRYHLGAFYNEPNRCFVDETVCPRGWKLSPDGIGIIGHEEERTGE